MRVSRVVLACAVGLLAFVSGAPLAARGATSADDAAAQLFAQAQSARDDGRFEDAVGSFHRIVASHPASPWSGRALVESATCLVALGRWTDAMRQLQIVRAKGSDDPLAALALARNTILYRLHLRPGQASHRYAPGAGMATTNIDLRRLAGLFVDEQNRVHLATRRALYTYEENGAVGRTVPADDDVRGFVVRDGVPMWLDEKGFRRDGREVPVTYTEAGRSRDVEIQAVAQVPGGDIVIADRKSKSILRIADDGAYRARIATGDVSRLAVSPLGEVAAIDRETRGVLLIARDGSIRRLAPAAPEFALRAPVDVAFDVFGHLYVLERDAVLVFAPTGEPLAMAVPPAAGRAAIGAFRAAAAMALDATGRLYVVDEDAERIQIYH